MKAVIVLFVLVSSGHLITFSDAMEPTDLQCRRANQHELRVQGCQQQPCTIRKGERLPYEVDFTFTGPPTEADRFSFGVFISYYAVPPSFYGSFLSSYSCRDGGCKRYANQKYTFKNALFIDPKAKCTVGCNGMNEDGTGKRRTSWNYSISDSRSNKTDGTESGLCWFNLELNIVN